VIDTHPLIPTARTVRDALWRLADRLETAGVKVARASPPLPGLKESAGGYMSLLWSRLAAFLAGELCARPPEAPKAPPADDNSPAAWQTRDAVLSHRDWIAADHVRVRMRQQWRALFREFDVVLCPPMPTPAFPHDHNPDQRTRQIEIDGKLHPY